MWNQRWGLEQKQLAVIYLLTPRKVKLVLFKVCILTFRCLLNYYINGNGIQEYKRIVSIIDNKYNCYVSLTTEWKVQGHKIEIKMHHWPVQSEDVRTMWTTHQSSLFRAANSFSCQKRNPILTACRYRRITKKLQHSEVHSDNKELGF